jgi:hypothetical protein
MDTDTRAFKPKVTGSIPVRRTWKNGLNPALTAGFLLLMSSLSTRTVAISSLWSNSHELPIYPRNYLLADASGRGATI